jgi:hypothetical protein
MVQEVNTGATGNSGAVPRGQHRVAEEAGPGAGVAG